MTADPRSGPFREGRLPREFLTPGSSSFTDFLATHAGHLLPGSTPLPAGVVPPKPHPTTKL